MIKHGYFYWNELMTRDVQKTKDFYTATLGWSFRDMPMGDGSTYTLIVDGETNLGGVMNMDGNPQFDGVPEGWVAYIAVDDIDSAVAKVADSGGTVAQPPFDVPGVGRIAMIQQPGGAMIGWMTPPDMAPG